MNATYEIIKSMTIGEIVSPSELLGSDGDVHLAVIQAAKDELITLVFQPMTGGEWSEQLAPLKHLKPDQIKIGFKRK